MKKLIIILISLKIFIMSCGEGDITIDQSKYEPKIVIEAYLFPNQPVDRIKISRNLPLNVNYTRADLFIPNATVTLYRTDSSTAYPLSFNNDSLYYYYAGNDLTIEYGESYRLEVQATIDGKQLEASSVTKVPLSGFSILDSISTHQIKLSDISNSGTLPRPVLYFNRSDKTDFYAFSVLAMEASVNSFIYDIHPWAGNLDSNDVKKDFDSFRKSHDTIFNTPQSGGTSQWTVEWFHLWFYGHYRIIAYAGDSNLKDYYLTHANVFEMDGNLHEPEMNISGDGIGIFGSAIADTLYFDLLL